MTRLSSGFNASLPFHWFLETTKKSLFLSSRICCVTIGKKSKKKWALVFRLMLLLCVRGSVAKDYFHPSLFYFFLQSQVLGKKSLKNKADIARPPLCEPQSLPDNPCKDEKNSNIATYTCLSSSQCFCHLQQAAEKTCL